MTSLRLSAILFVFLSVLSTLHGQDTLLFIPTVDVIDDRVRHIPGQVVHVPDSLDRLHGLGFASFALTPNPRAEVLAWGRPLTGLPPRRALVLGTEGTGLTPQALSACHRWLRIPMAPGADSLNVATASGIAMWAMHPDGR